MDDWLIGLSGTVGEEGKGQSECYAGPFTLKVVWREEESETVIEVQGELEHDLGESFRSIIDLQLSLGERDTKWDVGNLWPSSSMRTIWRRKRRTKKNPSEKIIIKCRTSILSKTNLSEPSRNRDFRVLCASNCWYVDVSRLVDHGGIFTDFKKNEDQEVKHMVVLEDPCEMECLLEAVQAYDQIVVHKDSYSTLLPLASRLRLHKLMRHIEDWLMQSHFHTIRLLEIAVMYRMSRLYDFGVKELGPPHEALKTLHLYLADCNCTLNDLPPALYAAFKMTSRTIIM